jgi:hypothetical protein
VKRFTLLPLCIMFFGCGASEEQNKAEQVRIALPDDKTVPSQIDDGCECVEDNNCPVLEQVAGTLEVRNTTCQWTAKVNEASCTFETRFVAELIGQNGKSEFVPNKWGKRTIIARHLGNNLWCAAS